jgi:hypothetical protein
LEITGQLALVVNAGNAVIALQEQMEISPEEEAGSSEMDTSDMTSVILSSRNSNHVPDLGGTQGELNKLSSANRRSAQFQRSNKVNHSATASINSMSKSIPSQSSVYEQLDRVDGKFINVAHVIKSLPTVVKEIELQARQVSRSCEIYCTSEQCRTLLLSRGVDKEKVHLLQSGTENFENSDIVILAALAENSSVSASTIYHVLQSCQSNFYMVSCFGSIQPNWELLCNWFEKEWKIYTIDSSTLASFG